MDITRRLEFDAGHRIPAHDSLCRNVHGHRYRLEVTVTGDIQPARGKSDDGMVLDFGQIKLVMNERIVKQWDHAFLVWDGDAKMISALRILGGSHRTVMLPFVPTVENLAAYALGRINGGVQTMFNGVLTVKRVRLYETPNCWADAYGEQP